MEAFKSGDKDAAAELLGEFTTGDQEDLIFKSAYGEPNSRFLQDSSLFQKNSNEGKGLPKELAMEARLTGVL